MEPGLYRDRMARMTRHIFPVLGDRDTATITARDICSAVNPIWGKLQTAPRILDEISAVIGQAMAADETPSARQSSAYHKQDAKGGRTAKH